MRSVAKLATSALLASGTTAQVVQWDIEKRGNTAPKLERRADNTVEEIITNEKMRGGYFASCAVGTPPQKVTLQLDTGSSDIWVPASTASICETSPSQGGGCTFGSYDYQKSSSLDVINEDFKIAYVDGSSSTGDYISETFSIGDKEIKNVTMGLGLETDIAYGLVGVGYALNEASIGQTREIYDNLPLVMRNEGLIKTTAYSLWLNDLGSSKGSILFGGIDTDKYMGDLVRLEIQKDAQGSFTAFTVLLTSLEAHSSSGEDQLTSQAYPVPVVLDSGTTFSYLPQELVEEVWTEVGAEYYTIGKQGTGAPLVPCSLGNNQGYLTFGFGGQGGAEIKVGMDELVLPIFVGEAQPFPSGPYKGQDACQFGIQNISGDNFLLGDTFLRSAYVVYDLENNEVALAPTDFNATSSNIMPFPSRGAEVPSSTPAPNQNSIPSGSSGKPKYDAQSGFTKLDTSSSGSGNGNGNGKGGDDNAASLPPALDLTKFAIMGVSMGLMMVGGGAFLFF
ncbi:aspartic peptidase domain-containing protein [Astrocystis sublimbata]|nr:aspartic peptidase domain-containing protein [Astrocystis sublimbata]